MNKLIKNKRAQASDIMSWMVATLVIIVIIGVTLYAVSLLGASKNIDKSAALYGQRNLIVEKSFYGYLLTPVESKIVYQKFNELGADENSKNLAGKIFTELHTSDFSVITINLHERAQAGFGDFIVRTARFDDNILEMGITYFGKTVYLLNNKNLNLDMSEAE